jgi:hypothetical protein
LRAQLLFIKSKPKNVTILHCVFNFQNPEDGSEDEPELEILEILQPPIEFKKKLKN